MHAAKGCADSERERERRERESARERARERERARGARARERESERQGNTFACMQRMCFYSHAMLRMCEFIDLNIGMDVVKLCALQKAPAVM